VRDLAGGDPSLRLKNGCAQDDAALAEPCFRIQASMQREFPETPLVGVGAIIIESTRVVLVKRAHPPLQAEWSIPGGVLEVGELLCEAAIREAREETGLTVDPGELLGVYDRVLRDPGMRVQYHYVLIDFLCRRVAGDIVAASDAAEVRWFTREELPALKLAGDTLDVICKGFAKQENTR
jgi:8-oxo-dGTP diphosphatase